jgi:hypothetical protein
MFASDEFLPNLLQDKFSEISVISGEAFLVCIYARSATSALFRGDMPLVFALPLNEWW